MMPLILLVEDYADAREMYRAYLSLAGYRVETAANGVEAIEKARAVIPDLILMDLSLPVLDGWQATERLKTDDRTSHIPVIALTAHTLAADIDRARLAGCEGFIQKPCLPEEILVEVSRRLSAAAATTTVARDEVGPEPV
jgi:two-component system, cell cycle response regulator DivK